MCKPLSIATQASKLSKSVSFYCFVCWLCWVFLAAHGLSLVAANGGYFSVRGLLCSAWASHCRASLVAEHRLSGMRASVAVARGLSNCGAWALVAPLTVGHSWTRDQTCVPCNGWWIFIHCSSREVQLLLFLNINVIAT